MIPVRVTDPQVPVGLDPAVEAKQPSNNRDLIQHAVLAAERIQAGRVARIRFLRMRTAMSTKLLWFPVGTGYMHPI